MKVYVVVEVMECDYGPQTMILEITPTEDLAEKKVAELEAEIKDGYRPRYKYPVHWYVVEKEIELIETPTLNPIETAPKDGSYVLLFGPSGYTTTPLRCAVCRHDAEYRPLQPWVTHSNDSFFDSGEAPTHWMPLPKASANDLRSHE